MVVIALVLVVFFLRTLAHLLMPILQLALCGGGGACCGIYIVHFPSRTDKCFDGFTLSDEVLVHLLKYEQLHFIPSFQCCVWISVMMLNR